MEKQFSSFEAMIKEMRRVSFSIDQSIRNGLETFQWLKRVGNPQSPDYYSDKYRRALEDCLKIYNEVEHIGAVQATTYAAMMANAVNPQGIGAHFRYGYTFFVYRTVGGVEFKGRMFGAFWVGYIHHTHLTKSNSTLRASLEAADWEPEFEIL